MKNTIVDRNPKQCRACDNVRVNRQHPNESGVWICSICGAIFGTCYKGNSYNLVSNRFSASEVSPEKIRYFDFTTIGSDGIGRRHGWYDPETHQKVTQIG